MECGCSQWSCSSCGSFTADAAEFSLPCAVFCKQLLSRGKHRTPFPFSGPVAMLGVLSPLSWILPECELFGVTEVCCIGLLARACAEQVPSRRQGPWSWGELNGPLEALRPQSFVPVSHLKSCRDFVWKLRQVCVARELFQPLWRTEPHGREFSRGHLGQVASLRGLLSSHLDHQIPIPLCCLSCPCSP